MQDDNKYNETNRKAYERVARQYAGDTPAEDDPEMRKACRNLFVNALSGKRILELGCGPGVDSAFLQLVGLDVVASDFSDEFLAVVRERYPHIATHRMDMTAPDLPSGSFDGLYAFASFLHLPRSKASQTFVGFRKLLKQPGVLFMSLIRSSKFTEYVVEDWGGQPNNPLLFTCYEPSEIEDMLKNSGFSKIEIHQIGSKLYENLPRLVERGVSHYQILAFT